MSKGRPWKCPFCGLAHTFDAAYPETRVRCVQCKQISDVPPPDTSETVIDLQIAGFGIIIYSPSSAAHIAEGENYYEKHYEFDVDVQRHIQAGSIVGFGTGTAGDFMLDIREGYPDREMIDRSEFKLRLAIRNTDGCIIFRDIFSLLKWKPAVPESQVFRQPAGIYHITLCSSTPRTRVLGDFQTIYVYFNRLEVFPRLGNVGVPHLCKFPDDP